MLVLEYLPSLMLVPLCLSFCKLASTSYLYTSVLNNYATTPHDGDVSYCVKNVITEIIEKEHFIVDVILLSSNNVLEISKLHGIRRARYITRKFFSNNTHIYQRIYIISSDNPETFKNDLKQVMREYYFNPSANFILVLETFTNDNHSEMTKFLVFNNIYNVTIIARDEDGNGYKMYSFHSPLQPCNQRVELITVDHCSNYKGGSNIFPEIKSVGGCNFKLLTFNNFPLTNFDDADEGVEQRVIRYFAKYAGIGIELMPFSKINKFGQLVGNFTYIDIMSKVENNEAEGAFGGYFIDIVGVTRFSYSYPLAIDQMMVIVPRADYMDMWSLFSQRAGYAVILVVFLFLFFSIAAYALSLFPTEHADLARDILIIFGYFLNKITLNKFKDGIPETLIISSLFFSIFIIPYTIQAYMSSIMTQPVRGYEKKDFFEVVQCCELVVTSEWLKEGLSAKRTECSSDLDCLKQVTNKKDKSLYTFLANDFYELYKWWLADEQCNLRMYTIKEPVSMLMRTIYFRRGSVLVQPFNKFFSKLVASGLVGHHHKNITYKERLKCKTKYKPSELPLTMQDLERPFVVLGCGLIVATLTFAFEVLIRRG